jgi:hypothetical protein
VAEQRPVARPEHLDALEGVEEIHDALGLVVVLDGERDLADRRVPPHVDGRDVPDKAPALRDGPGDRRQLARAVRLADPVRVIQRHEEPPLVSLPGLSYGITATASTSTRSRGSMRAETSTIEDAG